MSAKAAVLFDSDDLLFDLRGPARALFAQHGVPFLEVGLDFCGGDKEIYRWFSRTVNAMPGFCRGLPLRPGAAEFVQEVQKLPVELVPVTAPQMGPYWIPERTAALGELGFEEKQIHFCWKKFRVGGELILEDNHHHVFEWTSHQPTGHALLLEHPWTKAEIEASASIDFVKRTGRCTTFTEWNHALQVIETYLSKNWRAR